MVNDLRLELRARNNVLWKAIFETHDSVAAFCRTHGLSNSLVGELLNLSMSPYSRVRRKLTPTAAKLVIATRTHEDHLFPAALYEKLMTGPLVAEVDSSQFVSLSAARDVLQLPAAQEDSVAALELRETIREQLGMLTKREAEVIVRRFGLSNGHEETLAEIGASMGVSQTRVGQVEYKALRKLRHPSRSRSLRPFIETNGSGRDFYRCKCGSYVTLRGTLCSTCAFLARHRPPREELLVAQEQAVVEARHAANTVESQIDKLQEELRAINTRSDT